MLHRLVALVGLMLVITGCSVGHYKRAWDGRTSIHTITVGGHDRTYRLYTPTELPSPAPLVVMLHGGLGTAKQAERAYGWDELADLAKFVVAYPDGLHRAWNVNGGGCCGRPAREGVDDLGFLTAALADIAKIVSIDSARVYATGISNGGIMAYTLACNTAVVAAIGPDSATQLDPCRFPHPTSVMHIHGTRDNLIRYDGRPGAGFARIHGPPVRDLNAFWRTVDQCGTPVVTTNGPVTTSTAGCADNRSVALVTVDGGRHDWPAFATQTLWQFFAKHSR